MLKKLLVLILAFCTVGLYAMKSSSSQWRTRSSSPLATHKETTPTRAQSCPPVTTSILPQNYVNLKELHYEDWLLLPEAEQSKWAMLYYTQTPINTWALSYFTYKPRSNTWSSIVEIPLPNNDSLFSQPFTTVMKRLVRISR